jgi:tight adherence protein B
VLAGVGVLAVVALIFGLRSGGEDEIGERLDRYAGSEQQEVPREELEKEAKRLARVTEVLNRAIERRPFGSKIAERLAQASLKVTVTEYIILTVISMVAVGALTLLLFGRIIAFGGVVLGFFVPRMIVNVVKARRLGQFNDQLGDTINLLVNGIRAGYSMPQAMESVANDMPPPVSEEFRRVVLEIGLGVPLEDSLAHLLRRMRSMDLDLMITAINVQHEVGGNLAEILDTIAYTIRERVRIQGEIRTLVAQGEITGYVLSLLPFGVAGILYLLNREYLLRMFQSTCGWIMVGTSIVTISLGFFIMKRITKIEI